MLRLFNILWLGDSLAMYYSLWLMCDTPNVEIVPSLRYFWHWKAKLIHTKLFLKIFHLLITRMNSPKVTTVVNRVFSSIRYPTHPFSHFFALQVVWHVTVGDLFTGWTALWDVLRWSSVAGRRFGSLGHPCRHKPWDSTQYQTVSVALVLLLAFWFSFPSLWKLKCWRCIGKTHFFFPFR